MNDNSTRMTPFDEYISNHSLQMMKLIIPFIPPKTQRIFAVYIKFLELKNTFSYFHSMAQNEYTPEGMLNSLRPYLSSEDAESFDQMMNMISMMSMVQEMQNMPDMEFDPMSMMAGMFAQDDNIKQEKEGDLYD